MPARPILTSMGSEEPTRFRKIQAFQTDYAPATVTQYESERSGMQVVVVHRQGPKVNGYFTLATEIFDDSGSPHTLEHLVFMGSRSYRFKGLLDKLASRAYGGTNAWTATDHTAYTLDTAGWEGFAQILPVYLEHLVVPTITDAACVTEVHHVDGEGNDAGVVYSEMQALQHTSTELMDIKARRLLYPEDIGFRYETGGMLESLRALTPKRIRDFHKTMYQPRNMCIVVVGEVDHDGLLRILGHFEATTIKDEIPPKDVPFRRPWIESPQPPLLEKTVVETIEFPEEDESVGDMAIAFFGPNCTDVVETTALNVLLTYLCGSSVSVLENAIVEKEELASSISCWWDARPNSVIWLQPTGVATEKLEFVEQRLMRGLKEVASEPLDMDYMNECIRRERRQVKAQAEESESFFATNVITDYLFGKRDGSTLRDLQSLSEYSELEKWSDHDWRSFLRRWISDANHVSILAKPSLELATKLKQAEEARLEKRRQDLGPGGLEKLQKKLDEAREQNEVEIPDSMLEQWPVPPTGSIHFIESQTARSGLARRLGEPGNTAQAKIDAAAPGLPLFIQFEDVPTNFIHITMHVGTSNIPVALKPLLPIFSDNFFNTPIRRAGKRLKFEQVVKELERDTISYHIGSGSRVGDSESFTIRMQVEAHNHASAVEWIRTLMFDSIFDAARLKANVAKQLADVPEAKRDGRVMASEIEMAIHNEASSMIVAKGTLAKAVYLRRLKRRLEKDPDAVIAWFEDLRKKLFTFSNIRTLVTADISHGKVAEPVRTWDALSRCALGGSGTPSPADEPMQPIVKPYSFLNAEGRHPGGVGATIVPLQAVDSSYSVSTGRGLTSYADPALPALLVAVEYLETVEGPLWTAVRGNGLAYGVYFAKEADGGYVHFKVYRSPLASRAMTAARDAIAALAEGRAPLERPVLEGAVSQLVAAMAADQATMAGAALQNYLLAAVRGLPPDFNARLLARVRDVRPDDIRAAMRDWLLPVFEPRRSNVVVCCSPVMVENLEKDLQGMGYETHIKQLSDFYDSYGLEADGDQLEDEEDDDDEAEGGQASSDSGSSGDDD